MMPVNLLIVRHGESLGNLANRMREKGDLSLAERLRGTHTAHWPLTKKGIEQAKATGVFLNKMCREHSMFFDRMYVSSYSRAMKTAGLLEIIRAEWIIDPRITERDWGDLDNYTEEERREKFAQAITLRTVEPFFWAPHNGESFKDLIIRIRDFIDTLVRADVPNVIVVCHGEVMKAFRILFQQMTPMEYKEMEFSKDPLKRIHNCQIDHYSRRNPETLKCDIARLGYLQIYRPSEGKDIAVPWRELPRKRFSSDELLLEANKLSHPFRDIDL